MKKIKVLNKIVLLVLTFAGVTASTNNNYINFNANFSQNETMKKAAFIRRPIDKYGVFRGDAIALGFNISTDWVPYNSSTFLTYTHIAYDQNVIQYETMHHQILLQNVDNTNVFACAYRIVMNPIATRNWGFMGIGSHSDTWYTRRVLSKAQLPNNLTLTNWAPKNTAASVSGTIGVGAGFDGVSISASVDFTINQLTMTSRTNMATKYYETDYVITGNNAYSRYTSDYYGFFTFTRPNSSVNPSIELVHTTIYQGVTYLGFWSHTRSFVL